MITALLISATSVADMSNDRGHNSTHAPLTNGFSYSISQTINDFSGPTKVLCIMRLVSKFFKFYIKLKISTVH